jgi:hypothetical protein
MDKAACAGLVPLSIKGAPGLAPLSRGEEPCPRGLRTGRLANRSSAVMPGEKKTVPA